MTKSEYAEYLNSEHWKDLRKLTLELRPRCERCELPRWLASLVYDQDLHVHHSTYANLWQERQEDIQVLCRRCHEVETFGRSSLKAPRSESCANCGQISFDSYSNEVPLCFVCSGFQSFRSFHKSLASTHWTAKSPLWGGILREIVKLVGLGAVLSELKEILKEAAEYEKRNQERELNSSF